MCGALFGATTTMGLGDIGTGACFGVASACGIVAGDITAVGVSGTLLGSEGCKSENTSRKVRLYENQLRVVPNPESL